MRILVPIVENEIKGAETPYGRSLYEIERKTTLQLVCESLGRIKGAQFIFIVYKDDVERYAMDDVIRLLVPEAEIVTADGKTGGAACSCLLAYDHLAMEEPMIIAGGDQLVVCDLQEVVEHFDRNSYDGGVIIFEDVHPRWSYVKLDESGCVAEAAEKRPISSHATSGFYYFRRAEYFVQSAFRMIKKGASVKGKYYVCPVYNEMVLDGRKIGVYEIRKEQYFNFNHINGIEMCRKYLAEVKNEDK